MSSANQVIVNANHDHGLGGKYLTFHLDNEEYGVGIMKVREIIGVMEITPVPHTPKYIKGVINLRGRVIPIIELRARFEMEFKPYDDRTCIIVVDVPSQKSIIMVGMLVDSVSEVLNIAADEIEPSPDFGNEDDSENILGMGKVNGQVKILLDVDQVAGKTIDETLKSI